MKATGEVMAIDRSFEARAAEGGALAGDRRHATCSGRTPAWTTPADDLDTLIARPNDLRLWALMAALRRGGDAGRDRTTGSGIDSLFLHKMARIVALRAASCSSEPLTPRSALAGQAARLLRRARSARCSATAAERMSASGATQLGMRPVYKMVDTCAAEFEAATPYFYSHLRGGERGRRRCRSRKAVVVSARGRSASARASSSTTARCRRRMALREAGVRAS